MKNALTIDVEDYFQVQAFADVISRSEWDRFEPRVESNTRTILRVLRERDVRGTFFVLGWVATRFPDLVREIHDEGHEIGTHGYWHELVYDLSPEDFATDLWLSLEAIHEAAPDAEVIGYRAPCFSVTDQSQWVHDLLPKFGLKYDSSIFPVAGHDNYGIPDANRFAHPVREGLLEAPVSTALLFGRNFPVAGGGYFRLLPLWLNQKAIQQINDDGENAIVYLHPWEIDPKQPRIPGARWKSRFRHYVNLSKTLPRLERLLERFDFAPMREVFADDLEACAQTIADDPRDFRRLPPR